MDNEMIVLHKLVFNSFINKEVSHFFYQTKWVFPAVLGLTAIAAIAMPIHIVQIAIYLLFCYALPILGIKLVYDFYSTSRQHGLKLFGFSQIFSSFLHMLIAGVFVFCLDQYEISDLSLETSLIFGLLVYTILVLVILSIRFLPKNIDKKRNPESLVK